MPDTTNEIQADIELGKQAMILLKNKDYAGLVRLGESNAGTIQKQLLEVEQLVPAVKSGWKTSEFWLITAFFIVNTYCVWKGITLPISDDVSIAGLIATYSINRHLTKAAALPTTTQTK